MTKRRVPNVVRGGIAIPLKGKTNYYYMSGRTHTNGGIDIGNNPKTGIEVEDGEVMHITKDGAKVFSAVPFLNGKSPAQKVMVGENPNKVFNEQERFKKVNKIKDDGTKKKAMGGDGKNHKYNTDNDIKVDSIENITRNDINNVWEIFSYYLDKDGNIHHSYYEPSNDYIIKHGLAEIIPSKVKSYLSNKTKLDYIGGTTEESRKKFYDKFPKVTHFIDSIANKYNISPELLKHRLGKEGFVDIAIRNYNYLSDKKGQQQFQDSLLTTNAANEFNGFEAFGLDDGYEYLINRKKPLRDDVDWWDLESENEKGRKVRAATGKNVRDNIILSAAVLETLKDKMKDRGIPEDKLETWTNAAFNMGPNHEDLKDSTFVENKYNFNNKKQMGGNTKKLNSNVGGFYSVTDRGKTRHYMIPSTGNYSARSAEVRTKKFLGGDNKNIVTTPIKFTEPNPDFNPPKTIAPISTKVAPQKSNGAKDWWADNKSNIISDGIGLVSNIAGSLISHSINKKMLNNLKPAPQPIAKQAAKLKTTININPQLDKMRETVAAYERNVDNNTNSSSVALARKQKARLSNILNTNELYGNKENIETELINKDRLNQQAVSEKNVTDYNKWSTDVANFKNTILEQKANNDVSLMNNLNAGVQNILTVRDKRNAENQTIAAMALANPNLPVEMFYEQGLIKKKLYDAYRKAYPNKTATNGTID